VFPSAAAYEANQLPLRMAQLRDYVHRYRPGVVFLYGKEFQSDFRLTFSLENERRHDYRVKNSTTTIITGRWEGSVIVLMPAFRYHFLPYDVLSTIPELVAKA
jgi:hypothetical protein